jgi:hypothetical protein
MVAVATLLAHVTPLAEVPPAGTPPYDEHTASVGKHRTSVMVVGVRQAELLPWQTKSFEFAPLPITTIYLRALVNGVDTVVALWEFASTDAAPPTVRFALPPGVTSVTAYEWCTIHGLWRSSALAT